MVTNVPCKAQLAYHIPRVDNFEASVPTLPQDVRVGDCIAVDWSTSHVVCAVRPTASGAYLDLQSRTGQYTIHRRSPLPVLHN